MRIDKAIQELKKDKALYESDITSAGDGTPDGDLLLALDMAISALKLQIPKKVICGYDEQDDIKCPNCKEIISYMDAYDKGEDNYCSNCGQALDWSDEE